MLKIKHKISATRDVVRRYVTSPNNYQRTGAILHSVSPSWIRRPYERDVRELRLLPAHLYIRLRALISVQETVFQNTRPVQNSFTRWRVNNVRMSSLPKAWTWKYERILNMYFIKYKECLLAIQPELVPSFKPVSIDTVLPSGEIHWQYITI